MSTRASTRSLTAADLKDQLHDIQDNVVAPILMRYGRHVFVKFTDGARARAWLRNMSDRVNARQEERGTRFTVNIGFTYEGLKAIGLSRPSLESFPEAFRVGMRGRARVVGDVGPHAPEHWEGGLGGPDIHAMALLRTDSDHGREEAMRIFRAEMEATGGVEIRFVQDTMALAHENGIGSEGEHFGFADPISQPPIEGADVPSYPGDGVLQPDGTWRPVKPGEFLLGYEDEAGPQGTQAPDPPELRLNGTYVVFRKLYQDVAAFRRYLATAAKALYGSDDAHHQDLVAAKIMGRWRSGCPVDLSPDKDDPAIAADPQRRNNFTYAGDERGTALPARIASAPQQPARDAAQARHGGATAPVAQAWRRVRPSPLGRRTRGRRHRSRPDQPVHPGRHRAAVRVRPEGMDEGRGVHRARSERAGPDQRRRRRRLADVGARRQTTVPVRSADLRQGQGRRVPVRSRAESARGVDRAEVLTIFAVQESRRISMSRLDEKVALVTGGARGIGAAIARAMVD